MSLLPLDFADPDFFASTSAERGLVTSPRGVNLLGRGDMRPRVLVRSCGSDVDGLGLGTDRTLPPLVLAAATPAFRSPLGR